MGGEGLNVWKPERPAQGDGRELGDLGLVPETLASVVP